MKNIEQQLTQSLKGKDLAEQRRLLVRYLFVLEKKLARNNISERTAITISLILLTVLLLSLIENGLLGNFDYAFLFAGLTPFIIRGILYLLSKQTRDAITAVKNKLQNIR